MFQIEEFKNTIEIKDEKSNIFIKKENLAYFIFELNKILDNYRAF